MVFDIGDCPINYIGECPTKYIGGCQINYIGGLSNKSYRRLVQRIYFQRVVQWFLIPEIVQ